MVEFKVKIYDLQEAFWKSLDIIDDKPAIEVFTKYKQEQDELKKSDIMINFMELIEVSGYSFVRLVTDSERQVFDIDDGFYYIFD